MLRMLLRLFVDDVRLACAAILVPIACWAALRAGLPARSAGILLFASLAAMLVWSVLRARDRLSHDATRNRD